MSLYDRVLREQSESLDRKIIAFLKANPNPPDSKVHAFAEKEGIDTDDMEAAFYRFATAFAMFAGGGKANEKGFGKKDADPEQLRMGINVEKEHTPDAATAERIALDHLAEIPDYYTRLVKMEREAGVKD